MNINIIFDQTGRRGSILGPFFYLSSYSFSLFKAVCQAYFFNFWIELNKNFFSAYSLSHEFYCRKPSLLISSCSIRPLFILQSRYFIWKERHLLGMSSCFITQLEYALAYSSHSWKWSNGNEPRSGALAILVCYYQNYLYYNFTCLIRSTAFFNREIKNHRR